MAVRITKGDIRELLRQEGRPKLYDVQKGLLVRKKGVAAVWTYRLQVGGKDKWLDLGTSTELEPDDARRIAGDIAHDLRRGVDVDERYVVEKRQKLGFDLASEIAIPSSRPTFGQAQVAYLAHVKDNRAAATYEDYRKTFNAPGLKALALRPVDRVTREELAEIIDRISLAGKQRSAVKMAAILSGMWTYLTHDSQIRRYGVERGMLIRFKPLEREGDTNPTVEPTPEEVRDALDQRGELTRTTAEALTMLIYTGQRRSTVVKARREHFARETDPKTGIEYLVWRMPKTDMKAKRQHVLPIPRVLWPVIESVDGGWLFPSDVFEGEHMTPGTLTQALERDLKTCFRPHGVRTAISRAIREARFPDTGPPKILHHTEGSGKSLTRRFYDFFEDIELKAAMLAAWEEAIGETKPIDSHVDRQGRPEKAPTIRKMRQKLRAKPAPKAA